MLGLERGLEQIGIELRVAAYVEIEAFIIANLVAAMQTGKLDEAPIWADVKTFPHKEFHNKIHGIVAGYPCQPFSNAGKKKGQNDPRHIFPNILSIIKSTKPVWCFFENVEGHIKLGYGDVYKSLSDLGYRIEAGIFSAEEIGFPHKRKRLFILAIMEYADVTQIKTQLVRNEKKYTNFRGSGCLGNPLGNDSFRISGKFLHKTKKAKTEARKKHWKRLRYESINTSKNVSNANFVRGRESKQNGPSRQFNKDEQTRIAKPGQKQYEREEPRTIEPCMGSAIDGYNFRTDLLRMYGNGVISQVAAKAFLTLFNKFKF